jgi:uncharacterized membrane protein YgcG
MYDDYQYLYTFLFTTAVPWHYINRSLQIYRFRFATLLFFRYFFSVFRVFGTDNSSPAFSPTLAVGWSKRRENFKCHSCFSHVDPGYLSSFPPQTDNAGSGSGGTAGGGGGGGGYRGGGGGEKSLVVMRAPRPVREIVK